MGLYEPPSIERDRGVYPKSRICQSSLLQGDASEDHTVVRAVYQPAGTRLLQQFPCWSVEWEEATVVDCNIYQRIPCVFVLWLTAQSVYCTSQAAP